MKTRTIIMLVLIGLLFCLPACSEESGATGAAGEWIKGKTLSVNVGMVGSMERTPFMSLRNDSDREVSITPMRMVVWYRKAGKKEDPLTSSASGSPAKLGPYQEVKLPSLFRCERVRVPAKDLFVYWR